MRELIILTDCFGTFLTSLGPDGKYVSMDVPRLKTLFEDQGFAVTVTEFSRLDMKRKYDGCVILYQTSEADGQFYKKYIEDMVFCLEMAGATAVPPYRYLKAHHNKGFMEIMRNSFSDNRLKTISSGYYGNPIEALKDRPDLPVVIKRISGAGSWGVYCARTPEEYERGIRKASGTLLADSFAGLVRGTARLTAKKILGIALPRYRSRKGKEVCRPFIIQNFIGNLSGDYKVLFFGGKYYTLYRENRKNDFRASGSGLLHEVNMEDNPPLLDFASRVVNEIDFPIIGMDIGFDGKQYHLLEFQMIHLGPYALQRSKRFFVWQDGGWKCVEGVSNLEEEFARSVGIWLQDDKKPENPAGIGN